MAKIGVIARKQMPALLENESYIFINGQAHDKSTLTPVIGVNCGLVNVREGSTVALGVHGALSRWCVVPDASATRQASLNDSTLLSVGRDMLPMRNNPDGTVYSGIYTTSSSWVSASGTSYTYNKLSANYVPQQSEHSLASSSAYLHNLGFSNDGARFLGIANSHDSTTSAVIAHYPITPGAGTNIITTAYSSVPSVLSEDATYWYVSNTSGATNPTSVQVSAVNKGTFTLSAILANTALGTSYPSCNCSNPYSASSTSKYTYIVVSNASAPFYTIKYVNYNHGTLTQTNGSCTIDWNGQSDAIFSSSNRTNAIPLLRSWTIHTATADYMCFGLMENGSGTNETTANMKLYVFTITNGTPTTLVYKQNIAIGTIHGYVRNIFPLVEDWTKIAIMTDSAATIYSFSDANGYVAGVTLPYSIKSTSIHTAGMFGVDSLGRIWVVEAGGQGAGIHVYSTTVATTITLNFASSSYNYTGSVISTSFNLSAYNVSGSRVATDIQVVFDSPNATFSDDTTTKTITTSASAETSVNIKITGPGPVRAITNVAI